ncbi:MAG TPA: hypothetical protein DCZ75_01850 [Geobacter sp.]|nr:hypothetical protein [Geobacter sp.]
MYALVDLQDKSTININVLTHLERERVKYLVENGSSFADAKKQAQQEVLRVFNMEKSSVASSEMLDLSQNGEDNAFLLAISAFLLAHRTEGDFSELLGNMIYELKTTGTISSSSGSAIITAARLIDPAMVRANLLNRYAALGIAVGVPDFSDALANFTANTGYQPVETVSYPASGSYGTNLLDRNNTVYPLSNGIFAPVSLAATLQPGSSLKVKVTGVSDNWAFSPFLFSGWQWGEYDPATHSRTFTSGSARTLDLQVLLNGGAVTLEVYENGSALPTWTKQVTPQSAAPAIQLSASDLRIQNAQVG